MALPVGPHQSSSHAVLRAPDDYDSIRFLRGRWFEYQDFRTVLDSLSLNQSFRLSLLVASFVLISYRPRSSFRELSEIFVESTDREVDVQQEEIRPDEQPNDRIDGEFEEAVLYRADMDATYLDAARFVLLVTV